MAAGLDNLKHIVVLMMENRSFDHMLGFAATPDWKIDGLDGTEFNLDSTGERATVSNDADYSGDLKEDPGHHVFDTLTQLYGDPHTSVREDPTMEGFVLSYEGKMHSPNAAHSIMNCFSPTKLPVLTNLAQQFCVCDRWFSSVPGPTFPNRAFAHAATSLGRVDMSPDWRKLTPTIYERLAENNVDAMIYYHDSTMAMTFDGLARGKEGFFGSFDDFLAACDDDDLPRYSYVEPRFANTAVGGGHPAFAASDQHPDHNVFEGEALIQIVFNAIWKKASVRNSTLLVVVYDEHGGLFDHVKPPTTVNPDGLKWANDGISMDPSFDFTRLGVRVPAVLISPYIPPGTIDHTVYDHASIIATARKLLIPNVANSFLTQRDHFANTFEGNLTLTKSRTGAIDLKGGAKSQPPTQAQLDQHINDHLAAQVFAASINERRFLPPDQQSGTDPKTIKTEAQAAAFLQSVATKLNALRSQ
jgi:phospholipase C